MSTLHWLVLLKEKFDFKNLFHLLGVRTHYLFEIGILFYFQLVCIYYGDVCNKGAAV